MGYKVGLPHYRVWILGKHSDFLFMTATAFLDLKQRASKLSEPERRQFSAFLIRLGQERPAWKKETAGRLAEMEAGRKVSVAELRKQLGPG